MALVESRFRGDRWMEDSRRRWEEDSRRRWQDWAVREPVWHDRFLEDSWPDWPRDWPKPRDIVERFWRDTDSWWRDWPTDWPRMDSIMPRFSSQLDRMDPGWRNSDFWRDIYPRWAEPIFKEGLDVKTNITNDSKKFAVEIDAYQFKPEELQVKTLDDTLVIEGRHEDIKDRDNFTKMYFIRKYQLPSDVDPQTISSAIDGSGRLTVEAPKRYQAIEGRERHIPIESPSRYRSSSYSRERDSSDHFREQDRLRDSSRDSRYRNIDVDRRSASRSPAPPPNDFRRAEYESKQTDAGGMRYQTKREEFRTESRNGGTLFEGRNGVGDRNGYHSESRNGHRGDSRNGFDHERRGSGSRQDYRVETPGSRRADDDNRSVGSREERREERSVRILRKTFN